MADASTDTQHALECAMAAASSRRGTPIIVRSPAGIYFRTPDAPPTGDDRHVEIWIDGSGAVVAVPNRDRVTLVSWEVPFLQMATAVGRERFSERVGAALEQAALVVAGQGARA